MIAATLCYIVNEGKTLMLHRIKKENDIHKGKWNGLGGKMESGETPQECIVREVEEESGLRIQNPVLKGILTFPQFDGKNDWLVFWYKATKFSGSIKDCNEGVLQWIDNDKILDVNLWEGDKIFLKCLHDPHFYYGFFAYENKKLIDYRFKKSRL